MTVMHDPVVPRDFEPFGRWIQQTIQAFTQAPGVWLLQALILAGLTLTAAILPVAILLISGVGLSFLSFFTRPEGNPLANIPMVLLPAFILAMLLFLVSVALVHAFAYAGMQATALKQLRGEPIAPGDLLGGMPVTWPVFLAYLLTGFIMLVALVLCCLPALFVWPFFFFITPIIVDRRVGAIAGIRASIQLVRQNYWLFFVYGLVLMLTGFAAGSISGVFSAVAGDAGMWISQLFSQLVSLVLTPIAILYATAPYCEMHDAHRLEGPGPIDPQAYLPPAYAPPPGDNDADSSPE